MTKLEKRMWLTNIENAVDAVATDYGSEVVKSSAMALMEPMT